MTIYVDRRRLALLWASSGWANPQDAIPGRCPAGLNDKGVSAWNPSPVSDAAGGHLLLQEQISDPLCRDSTKSAVYGINALCNTSGVNFANVLSYEYTDYFLSILNVLYINQSVFPETFGVRQQEVLLYNYIPEYECRLDNIYYDNFVQTNVVIQYPF